MSLPIVPALSAAFTVLSFIVSRIQALEASRGQLNVLSTSTEQLLTTLNKEFSELRLIPAKCVKPLADLEALLRDIHRFADNEKESGFLKMLFQRDGRVSKIEAFQRRIGMCINAFEISSLLNIQTMLAESKRARIRDAEVLHGYLNTLEQNNAKLLQKLEINQNNTVAMMVSIQKQLNHHNVDRAEQTFYTHTLEYLTSTSGQNVEVEDWMISSFEVDYGPEIGKGGFGTVYRGTWNRTEVAIKVLQNQAGITPSLPSLRNEIDIWSTLRHPNILQFLGANTLDDKPFIVMPYIPHNAREFLRLQPSFDPLHILRDISLGLECLHSRRICHGDLKAINVLVENSGKALLCDFGLARLKADAATRTFVHVDGPQIVGSRNWMAPEILTGSRYRVTADVYAFGMTLYELYTDETPLFTVPYAELVDLVVHRGVRPERPDPGEGRAMQDELWELAEQCWVRDPLQRPTATQLHDTVTQMILPLPQPRTSPMNPEQVESRLIWAPDVNLDAALVTGDYIDSLTPDLDCNLDSEGFCRLARQQRNILISNHTLLGIDHWDTLSAMLDLASTYFRLGVHKDAEELQIQVVDRCSKSLGATHERTLTAKYNLAATHRKFGRPMEALVLGSEVEQCRRRVLGDTDLHTLRAQYSLALTYYRLGRYKEAEELQLNVVKQRKKILGKKHHDTLTAMECLAASWCHKRENFRRAADLTSKVVGRRKVALGKAHPYTLAAMERLMLLLLPK
ncbi:kinase-like domain-containing protein [Mycena metata]|uniref:Kinase-like domain-containing protein n=1 Tax=Mycena metata TaxID=1033252 RepID=A0AAD7JCG2_9AGAR|nr:kinase-like domain-containing protein [Mycena metata]